jgi:hypothetical protein
LLSAKGLPWHLAKFRIQQNRTHSYPPEDPANEQQESVVLAAAGGGLDDGPNDES